MAGWASGWRSPVPSWVRRRRRGPWRVPRGLGGAGAFPARPARARFLGVAADFVGAKAWNDPAHERLWLYNLHHFDDLTAGGGAEALALRRAMVARWIAENPPGSGTGWEPYPTALRIVNWIKWALGGQAMQPEWLHSLAIQTRWLADRLEWRLLGNHLMADIKALIFAGLYFDGPEAAAWLARGLELHRAQLAEQVLEDGGHFERSPMYHAIMLEDLLDLINLGAASGAVDAERLRAWGAVAERMGNWLLAMTHPDKAISFFNDAAFGIAATPEALGAYAARLGEMNFGAPLRVWLNDSGYVRLALGDALALIDIAPIGPDYLPGHAHADTLSFELSLGPERLVVNGGTSTYAEGAQRTLERATASHSTVEVDGGDFRRFGLASGWDGAPGCGMSWCSRTARRREFRRRTTAMPIVPGGRSIGAPGG